MVTLRKLHHVHKNLLTTKIMRICILFLLTVLSIGSVSAQKYLKITDLRNGETFSIKKNTLIQFRYLVYKQYDVLVTGVIVHRITDSSLVYKATTFSPKREIKLSSIVNIDKCKFRRIILPSVVSGAGFSFIPSSTPEALSIIGMDLQQNTGQIFKQHVEVAD